MHPLSIPNFLPVALNGGWSLINPELINDVPGYGTTSTTYGNGNEDRRPLGITECP